MRIRRATPSDLEALSAVEAACFPPEEAATRRDFEARLHHYADHFWLMCEDDRVIGFLDGMVTDLPDLTDDMYGNAAMHNPEGRWQMIFGVNTLPEYRRQGIAGRLIQRAIADARLQGRQGLVLTCKDGKIQYYRKFGFIDEGVTEKSNHGGVQWHQMRLTF